MQEVGLTRSDRCGAGREGVLGGRKREGGCTLYPAGCGLHSQYVIWYLLFGNGGLSCGKRGQTDHQFFRPLGIRGGGRGDGHLRSPER